MPESDYARKHAVMCLRLAAECRDLAAGVATLELRARVLRMADMWEDSGGSAAEREHARRRASRPGSGLDARAEECGRDHDLDPKSLQLFEITLRRTVA